VAEYPVLNRSSQNAASSVTFRTGTDLEQIFRSAGATRLERHLDELEKAQISHRIKMARETAGLTQEELGDKLKPQVKQRTIANYESVRVPWGYLRQIAEQTGRTWDWLVYGDEGPPGGSVSAIRSEIAVLQEMVSQILERLPPPAENQVE
jgi:transcriptional regulator with XRE-family HTH domain